MMRMLALAVAAALLGAALFMSDASAQNAKAVFGTWRLVSVITEQGGKETETFGPGAEGVMSLDAGGRYVITIIGADIPRFASNNRAAGTPEENKTVIGKSIAHFGTYSVNQADKTITFKIERATFPNWSGTESKRSLTVGADELKFIDPAASAGGTATVTWKRAE
jgi:ABC-type amino acid transport substrate-binding protein